MDEVIANARLRSGKGEASLIGALLDAKDEDTGLPLAAEALRNEAAVLFMAGHETTANSLAWAWYLLSQAPEVEAKLHAEIDQVLGGRPAPASRTCRICPMSAPSSTKPCGLYPPVPILPREAVRRRKLPRHADSQRLAGLRRTVAVAIGIKSCGTGRIISYPNGSSPRMPRAFQYAYIPFSTGPRVCAGMSFGLTEMILCIATLAQKFRLRPGTRI